MHPSTKQSELARVVLSDDMLCSCATRGLSLPDVANILNCVGSTDRFGQSGHTGHRSGTCVHLRRATIDSVRVPREVMSCFTTTR